MLVIKNDYVVLLDGTVAVYVNSPTYGESVVLLDLDSLGGLDGTIGLSHRGAYAMISRGYGSRDNTYSNLVHREVFGPSSPKHHVDHVNGDGLDNRRSNLRWATPGQNGANRQGLARDNTSGFRGVSPKCGKWVAEVSLHGVRWRRTFPTAREAAKAYDLRAEEMHGPYATTNRGLGLL